MWLIQANVPPLLSDHTRWSRQQELVVSQDREVQDVMPWQNKKKKHENMKSSMTKKIWNSKFRTRSRRVYLLDCRGYNSLGSGGSGKQANGPTSIQSE